jgi:hypothetical protein
MIFIKIKTNPAFPVTFKKKTGSNNILTTGDAAYS